MVEKEPLRALQHEVKTYHYLNNHPSPRLIYGGLMDLKCIHCKPKEWEND